MYEMSSASPEETIEIGRLIASMVGAGDVVALVGQLGAGKTQLTKGIALGLGVADTRLVSSPTFVLVNAYEGRLPVYHVDAYRLGGGAEFDALGIDEMIADGVVIVEWADRVRGAIDGEVLWIELRIAGATDRLLYLSAESPRLSERLVKLGASD